MTERNGLTTMSNTETLPKYINVSRSITYGVPQLIEHMTDDGEEIINIDTIIEYLDNHVHEDMTAPLSRHDLIWTDEEGNEL